MYKQFIKFKPMKEDPLIILMYPLTLIIKYNRAYVALALAMFLFLQALIPIYINEVYRGNVKLEKNYIAGFIALQSCVLVSTITALVSKSIGLFNEEVKEKFISLKTHNIAFNKATKKIVLMAKFACFFFVFIGLFSLYYIIILDVIYVGNELFYATVFLRSKFKQYYVVMMILEFLGIGFTFTNTSFSLFFLIYVTTHCKLQIRMMTYKLKEKVKILNRSFEDSEDYDEYYQKQINFILKDCAKQYAYLQQFMDKNINKHEFMNFVGTLLFTTGSFTIISAVYVVINRLRPKYDICLVLVSATIFIAYLFYCHYGQTLMNECENFYDALCNTPWIYWNKENRKLLLMILTVANKPLAIQFYGIMYVNYSMILSAIRLCYRIFTIARKL